MENAIWEFLAGVIDPTQAIVLAALIVANIFTGILAAMINGTFDTSRLMDFYKRLGVIFVSYVGVAIVACVLTDWTALRDTLWVFQIAFLGDRIFKNLAEAGLPVPDHIPLVNKAVNAVGSPLRKGLKKG